jgi:hypothetical protein
MRVACGSTLRGQQNVPFSNRFVISHTPVVSQ